VLVGVLNTAVTYVLLVHFDAVAALLVAYTIVYAFAVEL